ncbi:Uncharacterised protein [uncultured archaeon]|nr:Uncharacterised protein [uncultured archaeon]
MNYEEKIDKYVTEICSELEAARKKHPEFPHDVIHAVSIMAEEAGESVQAANNCMWEHGKVSDLKTELEQTAAMCIRCLINL